MHTDTHTHTFVYVRSAKITPAHRMVPGDGLIVPGGSVGAELCLQEDLESLSTVVVSPLCCMLHLSTRWPRSMICAL